VFLVLISEWLNAAQKDKLTSNMRVLTRELTTVCGFVRPDTCRSSQKKQFNIQMTSLGQGCEWGQGREERVSGVKRS